MVRCVTLRSGTRETDGGDFCASGYQPTRGTKAGNGCSKFAPQFEQVCVLLEVVFSFYYIFCCAPMHCDQINAL